MSSNTAIFYDIENLMGIFTGKTNTALHLDEIYKRVLEIDGVRGISIQRAYTDWAVPAYHNLKNSVLQVGIEPIQIFNTNQNDRLKNASDVSLIIDAIDIAARRPDIENFVIASGDGIFAFLSKKLHEHGKRVIGCGFDQIANVIFRNSCDTYIALEKSDKTVTATSTKRNAKPIKPVLNLPRTKYTEVLLAANVEPASDLGDTAAVMHMVRQIVESLFVEETKDFAGLEISVLMSYINHHLPGFKVQHHGFKGIGEFMRLVLTGSKYCTYSIYKNALLIAPRTVAESEKGKIVEDVEGLLIATVDGERYNSVFNVPTGVAFVYTISPIIKEVKPKVKAVSKPKALPKVMPKVPESSTENIDSSDKELNLRKLIKTHFQKLSAQSILTPADVRKLTTTAYGQKTFGVRAKVLLEITSRSNIADLRLINGKVRYWKEAFEFNGKRYLVFKEWAHIHRERFLAWSAAHNLSNED